MVKIQETKNGQATITVPKDIMRVLGWNKGTAVIPIPDENGNLLLKEMKPIKKEK